MLAFFKFFAFQLNNFEQKMSSACSVLSTLKRTELQSYRIILFGLSKSVSPIANPLIDSSVC